MLHMILFNLLAFFYFKVMIYSYAFIAVKKYIPHVIIEYYLYPISPRLVGYTCELTNSSGYKSYSMTAYEISSISVFMSIYISISIRTYSLLLYNIYVH